MSIASGEGKEESAKENKNPVERIVTEVYICSCRKEYQSFPALYLHNKMKHEVSLRI